MNKVTIIIPVYGAWTSLKDCIESLKVNLNTTHAVLIMNDLGPEAELIEKNVKAAINGLKNFKYFCNPKNLGFVGNCNRAVLELDKTNNDILLLNSDTKVTDGFIEELTAILGDNPKVGAVSPRSNNATIATVPISAMYQKGIEPDKSYELFLKIKDKLPRFNETPTAHGFCILIRRTLIKQYGLFDEVFGKGYGEEVDFCKRISRDGYKSVLANRAYVFHLEARSFSLETKTKMLEKNNLIIRKRYPDYQQQVRDYICMAEEQEEHIIHPKARPIKKLKRLMALKLRKAKS